MINKVIIVGNLGKKPEIREFEGGRKVANFTVATNESYTSKSGEKVKSTEWHNIEMWDRLAEIADKYLDKGSTVYLEGKIKTDQWTDKDNVTKYITKIRVNNMQMLGGRGGETTGGDPTAPAEQDSSKAPKPVNPGSNMPEEEGDLPF